MTVRFYQSSDAGAPVLRGNSPGDLLNLLTKCLVEGYSTGPTAKVAAGWTKPFVGTNVACFKQGAGSNGMYLRVDDTSTLTSSRPARVVGYETMIDVNTGSPSPFPTEVIQPGGGYWYTHYSSGSVANPRVWKLIADEKFFWLMINTYPENGDSNYYYNEVYAFGDIIPFKPGDTTHTCLLANASGGPNSSEAYPLQGVDISSTITRHRLTFARNYTNLGGPTNHGWHSDHVKGSTEWGNGRLQYPHGPDGGLYLAPVWVHDPQTSPYNVRGIMPGIWVPLHSPGILGQHQTVQGQGDMAGKTFMARRQYNNTVLFEISDTWDR
ncbi:tail assembly protein [Stenotrophomonas phage vB_SmaS_DLP_3]|nr:tail assembly protein [Stenotrophomonas phage vB_SmaS_DLP_3]